ncbi:MAG: hypothetical protein IKQ23_01565 [Treponema sp.]|nr:hypothetical protein [Treponema sp.]
MQKNNITLNFSCLFHTLPKNRKQTHDFLILWMIVLWTAVLFVLPFILWLQSAAMPLRHPLSRVPLSLQPPHFVAVAGYAALPIGRMSPRENPSLDFPEDRRFALQISGLLSRASMRSLFIGKKE